MKNFTMSIDVESLGEADIAVTEIGGEIIKTFDAGDVIEIIVKSNSRENLEKIAETLGYNEQEFQDFVAGTIRRV